MDNFNRINGNNDSRSERAEKVAGLIDRIDAYEYAQSMLEGKIEKPSFEEFENFLIRINGIARDIPIKERALDGKDVKLSGFIGDALVPRHEDKEGLLKYAYDNSGRIDRDDVKYLIPAVINAVHFFADGNGRTSRVVYKLLEKHDSNEDFERELKAALEKYGRFDCPDINPSLIDTDIKKIILKRKGWDFKDNKYPPTGLGRIQRGIASGEISRLDTAHPSFEMAIKCFDIYKADAFYVLTAIHAVLGDEKIAELMGRYGNNGIERISPLKMMDGVTSDEWQRIMDSYYDLKKEHVKVLIDSFIDPDSFRSYHCKDENLKDYFIQRIKTNHENNA